MERMCWKGWQEPSQPVHPWGIPPPAPAHGGAHCCPCSPSASGLASAHSCMAQAALFPPVEGSGKWRLATELQESQPGSTHRALRDTPRGPEMLVLSEAVSYKGGLQPPGHISCPPPLESAPKLLASACSRAEMVSGAGCANSAWPSHDPRVHNTAQMGPGHVPADALVLTDTVLLQRSAPCRRQTMTGSTDGSPMGRGRHCSLILLSSPVAPAVWPGHQWQFCFFGANPAGTVTCHQGM